MIMMWARRWFWPGNKKALEWASLWSSFCAAPALCLALFSFPFFSPCAFWRRICFLLPRAPLRRRRRRSVCFVRPPRTRRRTVVPRAPREAGEQGSAFCVLWMRESRRWLARFDYGAPAKGALFFAASLPICFLPSWSFPAARWPDLLFPGPGIHLWAGHFRLSVLFPPCLPPGARLAFTVIWRDEESVFKVDPAVAGFRASAIIRNGPLDRRALIVLFLFRRRFSYPLGSLFRRSFARRGATDRFRAWRLFRLFPSSLSLRRL